MNLAHGLTLPKVIIAGLDLCCRQAFEDIELRDFGRGCGRLHNAHALAWAAERARALMRWLLPQHRTNRSNKGASHVNTTRSGYVM